MQEVLTLRLQSTPRTFFSPVEDVLKRIGAVAGTGSPEGISVHNSADMRDQFALVAGQIRSRPETRHVIIDTTNPWDLVPLKNRGWSSLVAMLILAFPEVRWTFCTVQGSPRAAREREDWENFCQKHGIGSVAEKRGTPLFDPYGLRQWVIERINEAIRIELRGYLESNHQEAWDEWLKANPDKKDPDVGLIPSRPREAAVLDEEQAYTQFAALMCYRNGFRVHAIETWKEAKAVLSDGANPGNPNQDLLLTIEDIFLNFPDQTERGNSNLTVRGQPEHLPALSVEKRTSPLKRRFLTVGHRRNRDEVEERLARYRGLRDLESSYCGRRLRRRQQVVLKPATGMFNLWEEMGLSGACWEEGAERSSVAPGYEWPPRYTGNAFQLNLDEFGGSHSAAGRLEQVAEFLLDRANHQLSEVRSVADSTQGAVLATQALELLACKTPTLSQEALSLKHQFEVMAECQFPGVEYHLSLDSRIGEIRKDLIEMAEWLRPKRKKDFRFNGGAQILSRLIAILEDHNEFEEVEFCRSRLRSLNKRIELRDARKKQNIGKYVITATVGSYTDWVLRSLTHFFATWFALLGVFTLLFLIFDMPSPVTLGQAGHQAVDSFLTISVYTPSASGSSLWWWYPISYLAAATGALNIGLLVTHLYSRMARGS